MLQAIRDKAHGIFAWVMLVLVGIPFALWGINNYFEGVRKSPWLSLVTGTFSKGM